MPAHPLPIVINQGIPVALNSDDPAVFSAMGLSYDFYQVFVASEISGLVTLAQLARDSIAVRYFQLIYFAEAAHEVLSVLNLDGCGERCRYDILGETMGQVRRRGNKVQRQRHVERISGRSLSLP